MYPNRDYQTHNNALLLDVIEQSPLATVLFFNQQDEWPHISHLPFIYQQGLLVGHLSRSHPLATELDKRCIQLKLIFNGPDGYISPHYCPDAQKVPTWNYAKVQVSGQAQVVTDKAEQIKLMALISHHFEQQLQQRFAAQPWLIESLSQPHLDGMLNAIRIFKVDISHAEGNFKLSQNKSPLTIETMSEHLTNHRQSALAAMMNKAQYALHETESKSK